MMITFARFEQRCREKGLTAERKSTTHWQIKGGLRIVSVYPFAAKGASYYIQGMSAGVKGHPIFAIDAALKPPEQTKRHSRRKPKKNVKLKRSLWEKQGRRCKWCEKPIEFIQATLDHIVALSKGGGNGLDNLCIACDECNKIRGNDCTEEELLKTRPEA